MQYNVTLTTTVEAPNADAAKQLILDGPSSNTGEIEVEAVPTKEWTVTANISTTHSLSITVHAESADEAEDKAHNLIHDEIVHGSASSSGLELAEIDDFELETLNIEVYDAVETDEEQAAELALATA